MKLPSFLQSIKPAIPRLTFKKSLVLTCILLWCFSLVWLWSFGEHYTIFNHKPFESITVRWLITAFYIIVALSALIWLIVKRLHLLQKKQVRNKEEIKNPLHIELNAQERYLSHWLLRLQRHVGNSQYLYHYPWYMIIGNDAAGKTTLLKENCKITELYPHPANKTVNVTVWLNDKAVIIEPDSTLIEQQDNHAIPLLYERLWGHLLNWNKQTRLRQPLNGIILTVDIKQLCTFNKNEYDNYVQTIQGRLLEISKTVKSQLPVYVIFTKLDLLHGFEAAFQSLDKEQRESILGVTFSISDSSAWKNEFDNFWQQWLKQLNNALPNMMLQDVDMSQRGELFSFVRQINGIQDTLSNLINKTLFSAEAKPLLLRGVYFTSTTQKGQMEDLFISVISKQYKLPPQIYPTWKNTLTKNYFGLTLFEKQIFNESNLATESNDYLQYNKKQLKLVGSLGSAAILALIFGWHYYYKVNDHAGKEVLTKVKEFRDISLPSGEDRYGNLQLPILDPIRNATFAYGNYHEQNPLLADMGLYQGYKIGPYVEDTYLKLLQLRFLPAIMNGLLHDLNTAPKESEEKLSILRVMRMIEDESGRNKDIIFQYMNEVWSQQFKGQNDIQSRLASHLDYALDRIKWKENRDKDDKIAINAFIPFEQPIKNAEIELRNLSIYQRIYQNLRVKAKNDLPADLNIRAEIGASFDYVFTADNENSLYVPRLLTRDGLNNYFSKQSDKLIELTSIDSWVLNITSNVQYSKTDREEIERQITEQYISDYEATWHSAYNNLRVKPFADIPTAITSLEHITSGEQPFRRAIQLLADNTKTPDETINVPDNGTVKDIIGQQNSKIINRIYRDFAKEISVLNEENDQTSAIKNATQKIIDIHRYLLAIQNSPSQGQTALKAIQLRIDQNNSDPIFELQQIAKTIPTPLGRWLSELSDEIWNVVMIEAIHYLEIEWRDQVITPYKNYIADRYPFNQASKKDVPLSEFERFFAADGTLDKFYKQNLKPFIDNKINSNRVNTESLIRKDVLQKLAIADKIRNTYFKQQNQLGIQFSIQPVEMSGNKNRAILNIDGQLIDYKQAATNIINLIWPNSMRETIESKLTLIANDGKSTKSLRYEGPWALLRLINAGRLTDVTTNTFNVRYDLDKGHVIYRIYVDESDNPFKGGLFSQFSLPDTLY